MEDVEDLTNTVFLAFAEEYQKIENVGYWLRRILFITFIKWFKKNKTRDSLKQKSFINKNNGNGKSEDLIGADIVKILNTFSDEKQKIVRLKAWGELDFRQIGRIFKKSEQIIIKIYFQTLVTLKNRLR
jgi:DNA-directed RNA polymerase specialized sigma24 family protein